MAVTDHPTNVQENLISHRESLQDHDSILNNTRAVHGDAGVLQQLERLTQRFIFVAGTDNHCYMKYDATDSDPLNQWSGFINCGGTITDHPKWHLSYDQPGNVLTMNVYARGSNTGTSQNPVYALWWLQIDALNPYYSSGGTLHPNTLQNWTSLGGNLLY